MTLGLIVAAGKPRGFAFALATAAGGPSRTVLTAGHVVRDHAVADIAFATPDGRSLAAVGVEIDEDLDAAVLTISDDVAGLAVARVHDRIRYTVPSRPENNAPALDGPVRSGRVLRRSKGSRDAPVLQLTVEQGLGEYDGYSGSPVTADGPGDQPVIGILTEQVRQRTKGQAKQAVSNTLYATPIGLVLDRFGLNGRWVTLPGAPPLAGLVAGAVAATSAMLARQHPAAPYVALGLERGSRAPVPAAAPDRSAVRSHREKMRALLAPALVAEPQEHAPDSGGPVPDLAAFRAERVRVALLGRPGAGKSTTLRRLFEQLAQPWADGTADDATPVPVFADLSAWHDPADGVFAFAAEQLAALGQGALAEHLPELARDGRVVLLLDGLNELPGLGRDAVTDRLDDPRVAALAALATDSPAVGCVLTCREQDFDGRPDWHDVRILDLDPARMAAVAAAHFAGSVDATTAAAGFVRGLGDDDGLRGAVATPFFLLIALAFYEEFGSFQDRTGLLLYYIGEALGREGADEYVQDELSGLAFSMAADGEFGAVPADRAGGWLPVAAGAGLVLVDGGKVRFEHQLHQEFLAALHLVGRPVTAELLAAVAESSFEEIRPFWAELDPGAGERVAPLLAHPAAEVRRAAATVLGPLGAADALAPALADADAGVVWAAALSLVGLRDRRATPLLVERLRTGGDGQRLVAARSLGLLTDPAAFDALVEALAADPDAEIRAYAAGALGLLGDGRAVRPLVTALAGSQDVALTRAASLALGRIADPRAVPDLIAALAAHHRLHVVEGLLAMGEAAVDPLVDAMRHDRNADVREGAVWVLGLTRKPRVMPALLAALDDPDPAVQESAAVALGHFGEAALTPLTGVLKRGSAEAARWAAYAMGISEDARIVPHLLAALAAPVPAVAGQAARSLRMFGDAAVSPLTEALHSAHETMALDQVCLVVQALSRLGAPGPAVLVAAAADDDATMRFVSLAGLAEAEKARWRRERADPRVVAAFHAALSDLDEKVQWIAALGLGMCGDPRAVGQLAVMVQIGEPEPEEPDTPLMAVDALGRIQDAAAVDVLRDILSAPEPRLRHAACDALRRLLTDPLALAEIVDGACATADPRAALVDLLNGWRDPRTVPSLVEALRVAALALVGLLRDPDEEVVGAAGEALTRTTEPLVDLSWLPEHDRTDPGLLDLVRATLVPLVQPDACPALLEALDGLDDGNDRGWAPLRMTVADSLAVAGDERAVPALRALTESENNQVSSHAAAGLARIGARHGQHVVLDALPQARGVGAIQLMKAALAQADTTTAGRLLDLARGTEPGSAVRRLEEVLRSLGEPAVRPLVAALADPDPAVAGLAAAALDPSQSAFLGRMHGRPTTAEALGRLGEPEIASLLAAAEGDGAVARVAKALLVEQGHPAYLPPPPPPPPTVGELIHQLADPDEQVRRSAAWTLGQRGDPAAVSALTVLLADADADAEIRKVAALSLGQLGFRAVPRLAELLSDPDRWIVTSAAQALAAVGSAEALTTLLDVLDGMAEVDIPANRWGPICEGVAATGAAAFVAVGAERVTGTLLAALRRAPRRTEDSWCRPEDEPVFAAARTALRALREAVADAAADQVLAALEEPDAFVRRLAVAALTDVPDLRAVPMLHWVSGTEVDLSSEADSALRRVADAYPAREPLIAELASHDPRARFGAAFMLARVGAREAHDVVVEAIRDPDRRIRCGAVRWVAALSGEGELAPLVQALRDPDALVRRQVVYWIKEYDPAVVAPEILPVLDDPDPDVRCDAISVLATTGDPIGIDPLVGAIADPVVAVRACAARWLGVLARAGILDPADARDRIGPAIVAALVDVDRQAADSRGPQEILDAAIAVDASRAVDVLDLGLRSRHHFVRSHAAQELGKLGDPRAVDPLHRALADGHWMVREDAALALRRFADPSSVEPLIALATEQRYDPPRAALWALAAIGGARAAAALVEALHSERRRVQDDAADALAQFPDDAAVALLVERMHSEPQEWSDDGEPVMPRAVDVLVRIGAPAVGALVDAAVAEDTDDRAIRRWAWTALARIGTTAIPVLVECLRDPDGDERAECCATLLGELDEPGVAALVAALGDNLAERRAGAAYGLFRAAPATAVPALLVALQDATAAVRGYAALALGAVGDPAHAGPVAALVADPDDEVQVAAAGALAMLGDGRGVAVLATALAADDIDFAVFAVECLGRLGGSNVVEPLVAALGRPVERLRQAAVEALGEVDDPRVLPVLDRLAAGAGDRTEEWTHRNAAAVVVEQIRERGAEPPHDTQEGDPS